MTTKLRDESDGRTVRLVSQGPTGKTSASHETLRTKMSTLEHKTRKTVSRETDDPTIRLAHIEGAQGSNVLRGRHGVIRVPDSSLPALLVSYYYVKGFLAKQSEYRYRDWALDSGAFSAASQGEKIDLNEFTDKAAQLLHDDPTLTEVFALDVIGDPEATMRNTEKMVAAGVPAIPAFHYGSAWHYLEDMAKRFPKIALGGAVGLKGNTKLDWAKQCFARIWPKRVHGFGFGSERAAMEIPFHSVDATNWQLGATKFGTWQSFGGAQLSIKGSNQNLRSEIEHYLRIERRARRRWAATWTAVRDKLR